MGSSRLVIDDVEIVLATPNVAYEQRVRQAFQGTLNGQLRHLRMEAGDDPVRAAVTVAATGSGVVVLGPGLPADVALSVAAHLDRDHPGTAVLLVAEPTTDLLRAALRAGVRDVIGPDANDHQIRDAVDRARQAVVHRHGTQREDGSSGRVVSVVSPKGGSGKTTVATSLAVGLAAQAPEQVVLVDLDVHFGDTASALQLVPEHTIADAARTATDATTLKVFLTAHPCGLYVLCGSDDPADGDEVRGEDVVRILGLLGDEFRYVIVDTPAGIDEPTLAAIESSTDLVLLATMDVPSVRSLRKEIVALDKIGVTEPVRHFVLNRADTRVGLQVDDVAAMIGMPVDVSIPSSRSVPIATNQGVPVLLSEPRSPVSQRLSDLVARFAEQPADRAPSGLRRLFR